MFASLGFVHAADPTEMPIKVPAGFTVTRAAGPPLVQRPMFAALDDQGNLYVLDSGGVNGKDRGQKPPDVIRRLTDTDDDGVYDQSSVYADQIVFGTGMVWHDGALFITSPPSLWKLEDANGDGVADKRTELVTGFAFNQSCSDDLHGACLGPDGRIYFLPGRFPHKVRVPGGPVLREGFGPWVMRCHPDGSEVEFVSGAVGNPVEIAFQNSGDAFIQGTFWAKPAAEKGLRDALIHAVDGGEYSVRDRDYQDRIRTGEFLPALVPLTATAPSGLTAYASAGWGDEYRGNLFGSHFNTGKILRHRLQRERDSYTTNTEEFITGTQGEVHFTDVMEHADGSLLAIDTGGWFRACCPASGVAKPEVYGTIYRITKNASRPVPDPFGKQLKWSGATASDLIPRLADSRLAVRERAIQSLSKLGEPAVKGLRELLQAESRTSSEVTQNALWTLCRMDLPTAREVGRMGLSDPAAEVRQVAASVAALHRDAASLDQLQKLLIYDPEFAVRREAANALGRIGKPSAIPALMQAIASTREAPFLEHALVLALIRINDPAATRRGLETFKDNPNQTLIHRAALTALDQMPAGDLKPTDVTTLLNDSDPKLQATALQILRRKNWTNELLQLIEQWLSQRDLSDLQRETILGSVRVLRSNREFSAMFDRQLAMLSDLAPAAQEVLIAAAAALDKRQLSTATQEAIGAAVDSPLDAVSVAALRSVGSLQLTTAKDRVRQHANAKDSNSHRKLIALQTLANLSEPLNAGEFEYLLSRMAHEVALPDRLLAVGVVSQSKVSEAQLRLLLPFVRDVGPVELPQLLVAFKDGSSAEVGTGLVEALEKSTVNLSPELVSQTLKPYPAEVHLLSQPLLTRLRKSAAEQGQRLDALTEELKKTAGNIERGRELFLAKANCHLCHRAEGRGGKIGPDLTGIGAIRTRRELLEAIVFPSSTFARGYEPVLAVLTDGRVVTGLLGRETATEVILIAVQEGKPVEVPLRKADIEEMQLGRVSTMPQGLDGQLKVQELSDLVSYLEHLKATQAVTTQSSSARKP